MSLRVLWKLLISLSRLLIVRPVPFREGDETVEIPACDDTNNHAVRNTPGYPLKCLVAVVPVVVLAALAGTHGAHVRGRNPEVAIHSVTFARAGTGATGSYLYYGSKLEKRSFSTSKDWVELD